MRNRFLRRHSIVVLVLVLCICWQSWQWFAHFDNTSIKGAAESAPHTVAPTSDDAFVVRSGASLMLDGQPFRFSGANSYWLGLQDNNDGSIAYPSHFEVDDALATASWMGNTVVRAHTLGISVGCKLCIEPSLGTFNQTALQHIDYALLSAKIHHIKLIIPLVDNWHYYHGGKYTFTRWRGLPDEQAFYSNPLVINDFETYIHTLLNHINSYTSIAYKDDPTILAWETGNELSAPFSWVQTISSSIKKEDQHHLVMDGNYEQANESGNFLPDLSIKTIDLYSGHYYPPTSTALQTELQQVKSTQKVFIVGEFDWNTKQGDSLSSFLSRIEQSGVVGDLYWTLFPHDDAHGFVYHNEHFALHYPGDTPDMRKRVFLLTAHAYAMRGLAVPTTATPGIPLITALHSNRITWRGAVGSDTYSVERSTQRPQGPWTEICHRCATDLSTPWRDSDQPLGTVLYRVRGYSVAGVPGLYSPVYQFDPSKQ